MSERLGPVNVSGDDPARFLRHGPTVERNLSDQTAREVDLEIRRIVSDQERRVRALLSEQKRRLVAVARVLRDRETLDAPTFKGLLEAPFKKRAATDA